MASKRSPARLVVALAIAALLAVFLLYTSIAGNATPALGPASLPGHTGTVSLTGKVVGTPTGDAHGEGLRFTLREIEGTETVRVVYTGTVPDMFKSGRDLQVTGALRNGVFVAEPGSMITKCPSKYQAEPNAT